MEPLVMPGTKRIKCYRCYNYIIIKKNKDNSFSGYCQHCKAHIHVVERSKETLVRIAHS